MYQLHFTPDQLKVLVSLDKVTVACIDEEIVRQQRRQVLDIIRELPIDILLDAKCHVINSQGGRAVSSGNLTGGTQLPHDTQNLSPTKSLKNPASGTKKK